ncbi:energy-coupling factor transporter transmembrane component T [Corynebacterium sp. 335C]
MNPATTAPAGPPDAGAAAGAEAPATAADVVRRGEALRVDPRTVLLMLLAGNALAMANLPARVYIAVGAVACVLLATVGRWRTLAWVAGLLVVFSAGYLLIPRLTEGTGWALLGVTCLWFARFAVTIGLGLWAIRAVRPAELMSALRAVRCPKQLLIPVAVVLRMLPVIMREARAITEAMSLRGVSPGARGFVAHPLRYGELVLVPLLSMVVRSGDDLAAAAIIRGLGAGGRQTTITKLRFRAMDGVVLVFLAGLVALAVAS